MLKKNASLIMFLIFMMCTAAISINVHPTNAQPTAIYVDSNNTTGPWNGNSSFPYENITSGLEHAASGDMLLVRSGTYYEHIEINKTINLIGQNQTSTTIDGSAQSYTPIIMITASNVTIANFTIRNTASDIETYGILTSQTQNITITKNTIKETYRGMMISNTSQCKIFSNQIISNYAFGITLRSESNQNLFTENNIAENNIGASLDISCQDNKFYHNSFVNNNAYQVDNVNYGTRTKWNSTYPTGGNYWSDYTGVDLFSGPNQNQNGSDGIGDTPYVAGGARDYHPLMHPYIPMPPIAKFTYSPETPLKNEMITFNASASYDLGGSIASYKWDFGDGNTTSVTNPIITHSYPDYGNYTISLTATDNDGLTSTATKKITVQKKTSALSIAINPATIEIGKSTIISGNLSIQDQPPNKIVYILIQHQTQGETNWTTLTIVATDLSGFYQYNWTPPSIKTYELEALWNGNDTALSANSAKVTLNVSKKSSTLTISSNLSKVTIGQNVTLSGKLRPEKEGADITISLYHYQATSKAWIWITIIVVETDQSSNYSYNWTTTEAGWSVIKASWQGDDKTSANETSMSLTVDLISSIITITVDSTKAIVGTNITISGEIAPLHANVNVTLSFTIVNETGSWNTIVKTDINGNYTYVWMPTTKGIYRIKASWQGDSITASAQSNETEVDIQSKVEIPFTQYVIAALVVATIFVVLGAIVWKTKKK